MIIFFGPAGSGKSLQGQILAIREDWTWLSVGQILRESNDPEVINIMQTGQLVPTEKVDEILEKELDKIPDKKTVILDGFPREINQAKWLVEKNILKGGNEDLIILIDVPYEMLLERMLNRKRSDDTPEIIAKRLSYYNELTNPVIDYLKSQKVKVINIDGSGKVGEIHDHIMAELARCSLV